MDIKLDVKSYPICSEELSAMLKVWEQSVRATHHFLTRRDIQDIKPFVEEALLHIEKLVCIKNAEDSILAFMGIQEYKIEMLFIDPYFRGKGIGKQLIRYAVHELNVRYVDVNEQNEQAYGFYKQVGFCVTSRSELDGMEKPFPILHMKWSL